MNLPSQSITEAFYAATLLIYIYIYIYIREEMNPPGQLITEALYTSYTTYIYTYRREIDTPLVN